MAASEDASPHYDYILIGTDLRQSILAAALAKSGRSVLHIDENEYYGGSQATLSLVELAHQSSSSCISCSDFESSYPISGSATLPPELSQVSRRYNLSLCPTLVPAVSPFVDTLVRSGVAKYASFSLLDAVSIYEGGQIRRTASAKEEIFNDKTLSLIDKRKIMKFLMFASTAFEETATYKDHSQSPFKAFLSEQFSLTGALSNMVLYAAALSSSSQDTTAECLHRIRKYMKATGRFGRSPFLCAQYGGIGELIQGFCRVCAVYGGTYMLGRPIIKYTASSSNLPATIQLADDEVYTADCVITADESKVYGKTHRAVIILNRPLQLQGLSGAKPGDDEEGERPESTIKQAENAVLVIPPASISDNMPQTPVSALMNGEGSYSAPSGQYVLYLSCQASGEQSTAHGALEPCLRTLLQASESSDPTEAQIAPFYYSESHSSSVKIDRQGTADAFQVASDRMPFSEVCDNTVEECRRIFEGLTGEAELFEEIQADPAAEDED